MSEKGHTIHFHSGETNINLKSLTKSINETLGLSVNISTSLMTSSGLNKTFSDGVSTFTFKPEFMSIPKVVLTPVQYNIPDSQQNIGFLTLSSVTTANFTVVSYNSDGYVSSMRFNWVATTDFPIPKFTFSGLNKTFNNGVSTFTFETKFIGEQPVVTLTPVQYDVPGSQQNIGFLTISSVTNTDFTAVSYNSDGHVSSMRFGWVATNNF